MSNVGATVKRIVIKEHNVSLPVTEMFAVSGFDDAAFSVIDHGSDFVRFVAARNGLEISKKFTLWQDNLLRTKIEIVNQSSGERQEDLDILGFKLDISRMDKDMGHDRDRSLLEYSISADNKAFRKGDAYKFSEKSYKKQQGGVDWEGFRSKYFCMITIPQFKTTGYEIKPRGEKALYIYNSLENIKIGVLDKVVFDFVTFSGPQKLSLLKSHGMGFDQIMKFSNFGLLDSIAKGIYIAMHWMHKVIPNWGVCILLISVLIYGALYPLTIKGMSSMKKMQALQPKMAALREQYKTNPQKLNKEVMELYKEHKINPLGGCLPLLLQMPIFIGLYQVLWRSVDFKGAKFLWIKDLSLPDRLFTLPVEIPFIGSDFNILPILMVVIMVWQQKISAKNTVITDPAQASQQKMMMTIFPVFIGFIFYKLASGLCLYFTVFYVLSTFTQWKMSKMTKVL